MAVIWPLDITVTDTDIRNGVPGDPCNCALGLAVKRVIPEAAHDSLDVSESLWWQHKGHRYFALLPFPVRIFREMFDHRQPVQPIAFHASARIYA